MFWLVDSESHGYIVISRPIVAVKAGTFLEGGGRAWSCGRDTPIDRCRDRAGAIRLLPGRRARDACNADLDAFAALRSLRRCAHSNWGTSGWEDARRVTFGGLPSCGRSWRGAYRVTASGAPGMRSQRAFKSVSADWPNRCVGQLGRSAWLSGRIISYGLASADGTGLSRTLRASRSRCELC